MDHKFTVVLDEPELPELVHEGADVRSGRADHFRQRLLAYLRYDRLRLSLVAEVRHQQQHPRESLLARIEELVD